MNNTRCSVKQELISDHHSEKIQMITLLNGSISIKILNIGATIYAINLPDKHGHSANIVLNYDDPLEYLNNKFYLGSTIGRVTGRIAEGKLPVEDVIHQLSKNERGLTHLHGGAAGFNKQIFTITDTSEENGEAMVELVYRSQDGEEGYPGNLELHVKYTLDNRGALRIDYKAITDKATHINITNHSYFNLSGTSTSSLNQFLQINARQILATGENYLPTGDTIDVTLTNFDFTQPVQITSRKEPGDLLFNEYYLLDGQDVKAVLYDADSGRKMKLYTSYPGLLFYSADFLDKPFIPCQGICLEAQYPPNAPNMEYARMTLLKPGEVFSEFIRFSFSTE